MTKQLTSQRSGFRTAHLALAGIGLLGLAQAQGTTREALSAAVPQAEEAAAEPRPVTRGRLTLRDHDVDVVINNGFATTTIVQVLDNTTATALDATWAFPLPDEAALSELALWIDGSPQIGEVVEAARAKEIHEHEKAVGESTALAEQDGFSNYRLSMSPVPAGGEVRVRIVYYQPLDVDQGVGRYLYPLQNGNTEDPGAGMDASFWSMDKSVAGQMSLDVSIKTSFPITGLHSPSHAAMSARQKSENLWTCSWVGTGPVLDRDFVLLYRLAEDLPARVELLTSRYADQGEGTFMAVMTPGEDLEEITYGTDWIFVLDISGSMQGDKLRVMGRGTSDAIRSLRPQDRFQVILFDNLHRVLTRSWVKPGSPEAQALLSKIDRLKAGGGTNIFGALGVAYERLDADRPSAIILVSDGVANTGPHEYRDFIEMAKTHDGRLFTFVMGNGANTTLLGDLASLSGGFAKSVSVQDEVGAHLMLARDRMSHEAMHGVEFELPGATVAHPKRLPSLYLGQQLIVFGRYRATGKADLRLSARISGEKRTWSVPVELPAIDESNPELERLYAMAAIKDLERAEWLDGQSEGETRSSIVDMAMAYSLVTDHTSMVVVRDSSKGAYGLGWANQDRRRREENAAEVRSIVGNQVQAPSGGQPLGGSRAASAPRREQQRRSSGGGGAAGPLEILGLSAALLLMARRRKKNGLAQ